MESNLGESKLELSKLGQWSTDRLEQFLINCEGEIARIRAAQMEALSELDHRQVATADGCRSLHEWTASRLDLAPENAKTLVSTSRRIAHLTRTFQTAFCRGGLLRPVGRGSKAGQPR
jgi:hypothetical protein